MTVKRLATAPLIAVTAGLCALLTLACGQTSPLAPYAHEATPIPVTHLYSEIFVLRHLEDEWKGHLSPPFYGRITIGEDAAIRFYIEERFWARDKYVECKFDDEADVESLRSGQFVLVEGELDKAFPGGFLGFGREFHLTAHESVKFKHCKLLPFTIE